MLVAPKYEGLDLPVHDADTFVAIDLDLHGRWCREDVLKNYTMPTFVRAMMVQLHNLSHAPRSATDLLEKTDQELEKVAELSGALVVGHEWGLYPVNGKGQDYRRYLPAARGLGGIITLPKSHVLVAEVEIIKPVDLKAPTDDFDMLDRLETGVDRYYEEGRSTYQLDDMRNRYTHEPRTEQFIWGTSVGSPDDQPETHLVDIEPRFGLTR